ncbi:MAG: hypothetical protein J3K34DRAFT_410635 [Monoraphidium minutum]|nr:MAG: hypothetical protein J3K34DRAFT_410635 [Monoraphidium minutum]
MAIRGAALAVLLLLATALEAQAAGRILLGAKAATAATAAKGADAAKAAASSKAAAGKDQYGRPYGAGYGGQFGPAARPYGGYGGGAGFRPVQLQSRFGGRQYDPSYLSGIVPAARPYGGFGGRPGPLGPDALRYSRNFASASASAVAQSMVGGGGNSYAMAEAIVDSAAQGRGASISNAFASAAALNRGATAQVMARSASTAFSRGQVDPFAQAAAQSFAEARRRGSLRNYGLAMADACVQGGAQAYPVYGQALARAIAEGGDSQLAVAEATAEVFCSGSNDYASAWSSAFAVALSQDKNGCLVLSKARALATASCGGGAFNSYADSESTSKVLGFCGMFPPGGGPEFSLSNTQGGSNNWSGK